LARRWPPELLAQVADALQQRGIQVVIVGRSGDNTGQVMAAMQTRPALNLTDQGDLTTLGAVLQRMDLLLTNDGGPMHIATAVGTPVVAVFGLSNDAAYGPWDGGHPPQMWPPRLSQPPTQSRHTVVKLGLGCQPCFYRGHRLGAPQGCATRECLTMLPADMVLKAVLDRLKIED
jgi:heptosyltransferase-2